MAVDPKKCPNHEANKKRCTCTYEPCPRKYLCCECIAYHRSMGQLPDCLQNLRK